MTAAGAGGADEPDLVEETRRVASAVQDWLLTTAGRAPDAGGPQSREAADQPHTGSDCDWCPICHFAATLRAEHPELAARIGEAVTAMAGALRAIVDTALTHGVDLRAQQPSPQPHRRPRPRPRPGRPSDDSRTDPGESP